MVPLYSAAVLLPRAKKQRTSKILQAQGFHLGGWRLHHDPCTLSRCSKSTRGTAQTIAIQLCSLEVDVFWLLFDGVIFHLRFGGCFLRTFAVVVTMEYTWDDFANTKVKLMDSKRIQSSCKLENLRRFQFSHFIWLFNTKSHHLRLRWLWFPVLPTSLFASGHQQEIQEGFWGQLQLDFHNDHSASH